MICEPAWLFLGADEPDQHYVLKAPCLSRDMTDAELAAAHAAALEEGQRVILEYLDSKEFARMVKFTVHGVPVTDEALAADSRGLDSTLRHVRELNQRVVLDRRAGEDWESLGASDPASCLRRRAPDIIAAHRPETIDADVAEQMRAIVEAPDREKGVAWGETGAGEGRAHAPG